MIESANKEVTDGTTVKKRKVAKFDTPEKKQKDESAVLWDAAASIAHQLPSTSKATLQGENHVGWTLPVLISMKEEKFFDCDSEVAKGVTRFEKRFKESEKKATSARPVFRRVGSWC